MTNGITTVVRDARCKDCLREREIGWPEPDAPTTEPAEHFEYSEAWAQRLLERGGSRTDRCPRHRKLHGQEIAGLAVSYIDLETIGEVANPRNPNGPLGGLGALPEMHTPRPKAPKIPFDNFGMTDSEVRDIFELMADPDRRVLILKAGTGTGKSTFGPFRLLCPPDGVNFSFTEHGPIVVTEPRVQATIGVARYVGERLVMGCPLMECNTHGPFNPKSHVDDPVAPHGETCAEPDTCGRDHVGPHPGPKVEDCRVADCSRHIGPGYPVGYQVSKDKWHDEACQLVYITDGTMLNWLSEGRLNKIGTVIVDEAHERSTNIDLIMGYLKREIDRYPHLRVIVTSATFDVDFYEDYFGGPAKVSRKEVPAKKAFGYGSPLFPSVGGVLQCGCEPDDQGQPVHPETSDFDEWRKIHWPKKDQFGPIPEDGSEREDLWKTTALLHDLRYAKPLPDALWVPEIASKVRKQIALDLAGHVSLLVKTLYERDIDGDILAFLPNNQLIDAAIKQLQRTIDPDTADIFALIQSVPTAQKEAALEARPRGAKRKVVVSTNLAETSLTVSGVRFVVDSGLTTQGAWDPTMASKSVPTILHSQAGVRQRWGRVGRDAPGWVFPMYTRGQFDVLARNTPPGSTRENLEQVLVKAKAGGIDDVRGFPWPAAHPFGTPDDSAATAMDVFERELIRAEAALIAGGAVDGAGHLTPFGKELGRFGQHSAAFAVATMSADQAACVPEVVTALILLEDQKPQGYEQVDLRNLSLFEHDWPGEWRLVADRCWQQLQVGCRDDLDVALRIVGLWERADPQRKPWEASPARGAWARRWWLDHDVLVKAAELRRDDLAGLSPAMKEEVKRFLDPRLAPRARAMISRAFVSAQFRRDGSGAYVSVLHPENDPVSISSLCRLADPPAEVIALNRQVNPMSEQPELRNLVQVVPWAADPNLDAMDLVLRAAEHCPPRILTPADVDHAMGVLDQFPAGSAVELRPDPLTATLTVAGTRPGFAYPGEPVTDDESTEVIERTEPGQDDGTSGQTGWPGASHELEEDDAVLDRFGMREPDDDDRDESSGRALGIEANDDSADDGEIVDLLGTETPSVLAPRFQFVSAAGPVQKPGWYRCLGYTVDGDALSVSLEPVTAKSIELTDPAAHPDEPGSYAEAIVVGEPLVVRGRPLRTLERIDGGGRLLLSAGRRNTGNPHIALDSFHQDVVETLTAGERIHVMIVPTKYRTSGVTLIPLLSRHIDDNRVAKRRVASADDDAPSTRPYWDATVREAPNDNGFATIELLACDSRLGIVHRFGVRANDANRGLLSIPGTPVQVGLRWNTRHRVYSPDESVDLAARAAENSRELELFEDDKGQACLRPRRPISDAVRDELLCHGSPAWKLAVWEFYLQSHIRTDGGVEVGSEHEPFEIRLPGPPAATAAYAAFRKNMLVLGVVDERTDRGLTVAFAGRAIGFSSSDHLPESITYEPGDEVTARVHTVDAQAKRLVLDLRLQESVEARAPAFWPLGKQAARDRLRATIGATTLRTHGGTIQASFPSRTGAQSGADRLRALLTAPAAAVRVPGNKVGTIIGHLGENLRHLESRPGMWSCEFDDASGALIAIGESAATLRGCIDDALSRARLLSNTEVVDLASGQVVDWRQHTFLSPDATVTLADPAEVVDLRPPTGPAKPPSTDPATGPAVRRLPWRTQASDTSATPPPADAASAVRLGTPRRGLLPWTRRSND